MSCLHHVSVTLKLSRYARGSSAPWHVLWEHSKHKSSAKAKVEVVADDDFDSPRPRSVEKAVVFALFNASLDRTSQIHVTLSYSNASAVCEITLREAGISHTRIDGSMKQQERSRVVAQFMQDEDCHVLLASTRAAGLGLNLTRATRVIFMCEVALRLTCSREHLIALPRDRWWNPAVEDQVCRRHLQEATNVY